MTQEQIKAKELVEKMYLITKENDAFGDVFIAKQCALIAVDEIISACEYNYVEIYNTEWWNKVKQEILSL